MFKVDNIGSYDPYADIVESGGVQSNALYEYIRSYNKTYANGALPIKDGTISADLFTDDIDDYRKLNTEYGKIQQGYSYYDFDANVDLQKLASWQEGNPSFWDNWVNWGLWNTIIGNIPDEVSRTVSPIFTLKDSDLNGTNAEICERLLVGSNDVTALKDFYNTSKNDDKVVVLFRFATSDYYSAPIDIIELGKGFLWSDKHTSDQAYRAWESVFFDFDIIQLTFQKHGAYTVIPVVANPIDIVNDITPPVVLPDTIPWWAWLIIAIVVLIILIVLSIFIKPIAFIIKVIFKIILFPFKLLWKLLKAIFKKRGGG